ncbi:MAG: mechanosensitive ion channel protein MscS [Betaproteobacteria bacterium RIFCSPLOWO2_02_FULL_67_26]|nr:MAG: mechanosensitive ion channel protein MscS [Betaproteobacteria bacterium RIFCSPLOWO2_02_FULL_67_26]
MSELPKRIIFNLALAAVVGLGVAPDSSAQGTQTAREGMPVVVANRQIIILRGPIAGYTAKERATGTMQRIEAALAAENLPAVTTKEHEDGTLVMLGGKHAFLVTQIDVDSQAGETPQNVAREAGKRLKRAIIERREQETPRYLAIAAGFSALATLVYGAVLWLIFRVNGWAGRRLSAAAAAHSQRLHVSGVHLLDAAHVLLLTRRLITLAAWVLALVLASGWLTFVLEQFPYTRPWGEQLEGNLLDILKQIALAIVGALPGLLFVVVIFVIARAIIRAAGVFFTRVEQGRLDVGWIDADTSRPTRRIFNFVMWVFALAMAYPYLPGAQTEAFKGLSVLVGLMITIGASSVIGQAFNGLILMYTRAFRVGEFVRIGDTEGTVTELGMFATRVRTGLGEEITLPNSTIMATTTKNYSRAVAGTGYVVDTAVTIGYSTPWRQVHAMLEEAARRTPDMAKSPEPFVRQTALSDFYVEYRLVAYTPVEHPARRVDVLNRLHAHIQDVFNEHGVQIMSPHYMMDPKEPQVVPKDQWYAAPARAPERQ